MVMNTDLYKKATFAGGCFWCMEHSFENLNGIISVVSGYSGGDKKNPTYDEVSLGITGHVETIQITYDPKKIDYASLLDVYWKQIDPTDPHGSFADRGSQYRSLIFYHSDTQREKAKKSKKILEESGLYNKPIVTEIVSFVNFWPAEDYHQDFYKKNPVRYKFYRMGSGRDRFLNKIWKKKLINKKTYNKPSEEKLRIMLTPLQFKVTQRNSTENPFNNAYWSNKKEGIYVDIISGEPLFSSVDKYESRTGWPSFTKPIKPDVIIEKKDTTLFTVRTEVRSKKSDSHLGHVFNDGPPPQGLRYCINSAALKFIPREQLDEKGYGQWK